MNISLCKDRRAWRNYNAAERPSTDSDIIAVVNTYHLPLKLPAPASQTSLRHVHVVSINTSI